MRSMSRDGSTVIMKQELLNAKRTISELKVVNTCLKKDKLKAEHERNLIVINSQQNIVEEDKALVGEMEILAQKFAEQEALGQELQQRN